MIKVGGYHKTIAALRPAGRVSLLIVMYCMVLGLSAVILTIPTAQSVSAVDTITTNNLPFTPVTLTASQDGVHIIATQNSSSEPAYTSNDSGQTWTLRSSIGTSTSPQTMVTTPDGQTIFGIAGTLYYRSTDGGQTWTHINHPISEVYYSLSYSPVTNTLYGVTNDFKSISSSSDFGATWSPAYSVTTYINSVSVSRDGTKLYDTECTTLACPNSITRVSSDNGTTWSTIHTGSATSNDDDSVYANGDNSIIFLKQYSYVNSNNTFPLVSTDGGATWQTQSVAIPSTPVYFTSPTIYSFASGTTLYHVAVSAPSPVISSVTIGGRPLLNTPVIASQPTFSGTTKPFTTVTVTVHSNPVTCTTTSDSVGAWSCQLASSLPSGSHTVLVDFLYPDLTTAELGPYAVIVPSTPTAPAQTLAYSDPSTASDDTTQPTQLSTASTPLTTNTADSNVPTTQKESSSSVNPWWFIIPGVIIILGIIVVVIRRFNK